MVHSFASDEKCRDLIYDDDDRSYPTARSNAPGGYRFGRTQKTHARGHARAALGRINGYFKDLIELIANSKLRRMERELELRGIRVDRPGNNAVVRKSRPGERSR